MSEVRTREQEESLGHTHQELSSATGPPKTSGHPSGEVYQPPAVAWEEEFAPLADSLCNPQIQFCGDGLRLPPDGS